MKKSFQLKNYFYLLIILFSFFKQVCAQPTVSNISPLSGSILGGQTITITGNGFTGALSVSFGDVILNSTQFVVDSDNQITSNIPFSSLNPISVPLVVDVIVNTPSGSSPLSQNDRYAFTQGDWYAYIPDFGSNNVFTSNITTKLVNPNYISVGSSPNDVAISFDGKTGYVVNSRSASISVIDVKTMSVINTFNTGSNFPILVSIGYDTTLDAYVGYTADYGSNTATQINLKTGQILNTVQVGTNPTGGILDSAVDPTSFYVVNSGSSSITKVSLPISNSTPSVPIYTGNGSVPSFIVLAPDGKTAYFTDDNGSQSSVRQLLNIDTANPTLGLTLTDPSFNFNGANFFPQIAISPPQPASNEIYAYVTNTGTNTITPIDITNSLNPVVLPSIEVEFAPNGTAITPDGSTLYVCNGNSNAITIVSNLPHSNDTIDLLVGTTPTDPSITPDQAPLAYFNISPTITGVGQTVNFNGSSSVSPVGTITNYEWDFGDGTIETTSTPSTTHAYSASSFPTVYHATLTVTNSAGTSTSTSSNYNGQVRLRNGGITAQYSLPVTVLQTAGTPTNTTISTDQNPAAIQQKVVFTATVSSDSGTPTGTIQFTVNGLNYGSPVTLTNGLATINDSFNRAGNYSVGAVYTPTPQSIYGASDALPLIEMVLQDFTMTTLFIDPSFSALFGESINFTATVSASNQLMSGIPTGVVQFIYTTDSQPFPVIFATGMLDSNGTVSVNVSSLPVNVYQIYAAYQGDINHTSSSSFLPNFYLINPDPTDTELTSFNNPSKYGNKVTFTAKVTATAPAGAGVPTGYVDFTDNTTGRYLGLGLLNNLGVAVFTTTSPLSVGLHDIVATYVNTDGNYTSSSNSLTQETDQNSTNTVIVSSSANPSALNQAVFFTAQVSASSGTGEVPTGEVNFSANGTFFGSGTLDDKGSITSPSVSFLPIGNNTIVATYLGDSNYTGNSSQNFIQVVQPDSTTTVLSSSMNPSFVNQTVTFTAHVTNNIERGATPTGTVAFNVKGEVIDKPLINGQATLDYTFTNAGNQTVTATYLATPNFSSSADSLLQIVNAITVSLSTSPSSPSFFSQTVTFNTQVIDSDFSPLTGTAQFIIDGQYYGAPIALDTNGKASLSTSALLVGTHTISVLYSGDNTHPMATSTVINYKVNPDPTKTVLSSSMNPSFVNQTVTFTAHVTNNIEGGPIPTGTVAFNVKGEVIDKPLINGQATLDYTFTNAGNQTVTATYSETPDFLSSFSLLIQLVSSSTITTVSALPMTPSLFSQAITFTAQVSTNDGVKPTGTAQFIIDGQPYGAPVTLDANGRANLSTSTLSVGVHMISALYSGDSTHLSSTSFSINYTVDKDPTTTVLSSSFNQVFLGQPVDLLAKTFVDFPLVGTPTGILAFSIDGGTPILQPLFEGQATLLALNLPVGTHSITATYLGDLDYLASNATIFVEVTAKQPVLPPTDLYLYQVKEHFATQTDVINIIKWKAPLEGSRPVLYKIYRDAKLKHLVKIIKSPHLNSASLSDFSTSLHFKYEDHHCNPHHRSRYFVISVDALGRTSLPASVQLDKRKK